MHMKYFLIDEEEQTVKTLLLPKISTASSIPKTVKTEEESIIGRKMKTPILMASSEGEEEGSMMIYLFSFLFWIFDYSIMWREFVLCENTYVDHRLHLIR